MGTPIAEEAAFVTTVTAAVTNARGRRIWDIQVGRLRITLERAGPGKPGETTGKGQNERGKGRREGYLLEWSGREG
jgi:hypothetical protein